MIPGPSALQYPQLNLTEQINANAVTIGSSATLPLTWDTHTNGATLVDRTTPTAPTILVSGIYFVMVTIAPSAMSTGADYQVDLFLGAGGVGIPRPGGSLNSGPATALVNILRTQICGGGYIAAGDTLTCQVTNNDTLSKSFTISVAFISRIL